MAPAQAMLPQEPTPASSPAVAPAVVADAMQVAVAPVRPEQPASAMAAATLPSAASAKLAARREGTPDTPVGVCAPRTNFALYRCMKTQCEQSRHYAHPQCVQLRQSDEPPG